LQSFLLPKFDEGEETATGVAMTRHHLTYRPATAGGIQLQDDYIVRQDLRPVGRIHLVRQGIVSDPVWEWGTNLPLPTPWWCIGRTSSFETSKIAFTEAWIRFYDSLSPDQIDHWHKQQDASARPRDQEGANLKEASNRTQDPSTFESE
jgi:hypothetical protein